MGTEIDKPGQTSPSRTFYVPPSPKYHDYVGAQSTDEFGIENLLDNEQGYIVGRVGDHLLRHKTDLHLLTIAPTGAGKGVGSVIPNIIDHSGSLFVVDIRGETVVRTAQARMLLGNDVVVIDPFNETEGAYGSDTFNPLDCFDAAAPDFDAKIDGMARALMYDAQKRSSSDPIWDNVTLQFLRGALAFVCTQSSHTNRNLFTVYEIVNQTKAERATFIEKLSTLTLVGRGPGVAAMREMLTLLSDTEGQKSIADGAVKQAASVLSWIAMGSFPDMLAQSTFDFADLQSRERKTTVYLVVPEEHIKSCAIWIRVLFQSAMFSLKDIYKTTGLSTSALEQRDRVLFILDEMPLFGYMDTIQNGVATLRGRGANIWMLIQNLAQLEDVYGKPGARTILSNTAVTQLFDSSNDVDELEHFQKLIGDELVFIESVTNGVNETQGRSETKGASETEGYSETTGYSETKSTNKGSSTQTTGLFKTTTGQSNSVGSGRSYTRNKSQAFSNSVTKNASISDSNSVGRNHSTSIKPERMPIETLRSLRIKITGGNQLLVVRGMYPAFTPRMSYFARYPNTDRFMFPEMRALVSMDEIARLLSQDLKKELEDDTAAFAEVQNIPAINWGTGDADHLISSLATYSAVTNMLSASRSILGTWFARLRNAEELISNIESLISDEITKSNLIAPIKFDSLTRDYSKLSKLHLFSSAGIAELSHDKNTANRNADWLYHVYGKHFVDVSKLVKGIRGEIISVKSNYYKEFDEIYDRSEKIQEGIGQSIQRAAFYQIQRRHRIYCRKYE